MNHKSDILEKLEEDIDKLEELVDQKDQLEKVNRMLSIIVKQFNCIVFSINEFEASNQEEINNLVAHIAENAEENPDRSLNEIENQLSSVVKLTNEVEEFKTELKQRNII